MFLGFFRRINEAMLDERGIARALSNEELITYSHAVVQAAGYFCYLFLFVMWYCRLDMLVPHFLQVCLRMTACVIISLLFFHDGVWTVWLNQRSLGDVIRDIIEGERS